MDWETALAYVMGGGRVRRKSWMDDYFILAAPALKELGIDPPLMQMDPDDLLATPWDATHDSKQATDWEMVRRMASDHPDNLTTDDDKKAIKDARAADDGPPPEEPPNEGTPDDEPTSASD